MKKLILAGVVIVLLGVLCGLVMAWRKGPPASRWVTLPDGTLLRIAAVTYGTNHVVGSKAAGFISRMPDIIQHILKPMLGRNSVPAQTVMTPKPELLVWVNFETNMSGAPPPLGGSYYTAVLGDGSRFTSGDAMTTHGYMPPPWPPVEALHFSALPRRSRDISLNFYSLNTGSGARFCTNITFANPLYRSYPQWEAETLPATKRAGDLEVTLEKVETGHDQNGSARGGRDGKTEFEYGTDRSDGRNHTVLYLKTRPLGNADEKWQAVNVEVSDATGNSVHNMSTSWGGNDSPFMFSPGLWPDEAAWKLKLEVKRTEGFRPEEIFVFKNVPLGEPNQTNVLGWTTNVGGITIALDSVCRRASLTNYSWSQAQLSEVNLTTSHLASGIQFDLLRMVSDTGMTNQSVSSSTSDDKRGYYFRDVPVGAKTVDITFAVQHSRTVEFTVKPELPKVKKAMDGGGGK